jgi:TP901 family phage tail tape measure protein
MAADPKSVRAGGAYCELWADSSRLISGLKAAEKRVADWGKTVTKIGAGIAAIGAGAVATGVAAAHSFADMGSSLAGISQRTGLTVEALSELQSKVDLDALEHGFRHLQRAIFEAGEGSREARDHLSRLGLTAEQLGAMTPDQQLSLLADRFHEVRGEAARTGIAMGLFGREGTGLIGVLQDGARGLEAVRARSRELGLGMSTQDAQAAKALNKEWRLLQAQFKMISVQIGAAVAPVLRHLLSVVQPIVGTVIRWVRENRGLITTIFTVALGIVALGTAVGALGGAIAIASTAFGILATVVGAVGSVLAFLVSPAGLITLAAVAMLAAAGAVFYFSGAWDDMLRLVRGPLAQLGQFFASTWGGIADAFRAGDLQLALRITVQALKVIWVSFVETLGYWWNWLLTTLQNGWTAGTAVLAFLIVKGWARWNCSGSTSPPASAPCGATSSSGWKARGCGPSATSWAWPPTLKRLSRAPP